MNVILKDFPKEIMPDEAFKAYWWEFEAKEVEEKNRVLERLEIRYINNEECGFTPVYAAVANMQVSRRPQIRDIVFIGENLRVIYLGKDGEHYLLSHKELLGKQC
ncbi:MAG: hypothetical protein LBM93_11880 [Oscillospiraceae bacterium]|jgi:hypothetical protein|nr:hypothetical protein [Oscillospiraceae bacterium]